MVQVGWKFKAFLLTAALIAEWAKRMEYIEFGGYDVYRLRQPVQDIVGLIPEEWPGYAADRLKMVFLALLDFIRQLL